MIVNGKWNTRVLITLARLLEKKKMQSFCVSTIIGKNLKNWMCASISLDEGEEKAGLSLQDSREKPL